MLAAPGRREVQIDEAAAFAIILTAEAYVHEYARKRRLEQVVEKTRRRAGARARAVRDGVDPR